MAIHPYRESGSVDVNKEAELAKQRLLHLFVEYYDVSTAFSEILGRDAIGIRLYKPYSSKYYERTIKDYFELHKENDTTLDWAIDYIKKEFDEIGNDTRVGLEHPYENLARVAYLIDNVFRVVNELFERVLEGSQFQGKDHENYLAFLNYITTKIGRAHWVEYSNISRYIDAAEEAEKIGIRRTHAASYKNDSRGVQLNFQATERILSCMRSACYDDEDYEEEMDSMIAECLEPVGAHLSEEQ